METNIKKPLTFLIFAVALLSVFVHLTGLVGIYYNTAALLAFAFFGGLMTANVIYLLYGYLFNKSESRN